MSPTILPVIDESDYPAFQRLISEIRYKSYQEWRSEYLKAVAFRKARNGSKGVKIFPLEFLQWLSEAKLSAHLELLWIFAEQKVISQEVRPVNRVGAAVGPQGALGRRLIKGISSTRDYQAERLAVSESGLSYAVDAGSYRRTKLSF